MSEQEWLPTKQSQTVPIEAKPIAQSQAWLQRTIETAIQAGRTAGEIKEFLDLFERLEARYAEQQYWEAMQRFQADCPPIPRDKLAEIKTRGGQNVRFRYASLGSIECVCLPLLHEHGLTRTWGDYPVADDAVSVTCIVTHAAGHSERRTIAIPLHSDFISSPQGKIASAISYGKRHALSAVLGIAISDLDDDTLAEPPPPITYEQACSLQDALIESEIDQAAFFRWLKKNCGAEKLSELRADRYDLVAGWLKGKIEERRKR